MRTQFIRLALAVVLISSFASAQWFTQNSGTTKHLYGVSFTDANTGTVVGDSGTILRTTNGGATWMNQSSGTTRMLCDVAFTDLNVGIVVGDSGTILRTTNGGTTWTSQSSGTTSVLNAICCINSDNGTAVGFNGVILRTTNGGTTWANQSNGKTPNLSDVCFTDANTGTAVGYSDSGAILHTTNGGATWMYQSVGKYLDLRAVYFTDALIGTAVGGTAFGYVFRTIDGGTTWASTGWGSLRSDSTGPFSWDPIMDVCFTDNSNGTLIMSSARGVGAPGYTLHTTDGGATWMHWWTESTPILRRVSFTDAKTGTVVGDGGTILHTTNGGVTWVEGEHKPDVPQDYSLAQNYPNPFNPSTTITYELPKSSMVRLSVYDILGREVSVLVDERIDAGVHEVKFDGSGLSSGVYLYRLQTGDFTQTKRLSLLK